MDRNAVFAELIMPRLAEAARLLTLKGYRCAILPPPGTPATEWAGIKAGRRDILHALELRLEECPDGRLAIVSGTATLRDSLHLVWRRMRPFLPALEATGGNVEIITAEFVSRVDNE